MRILTVILLYLLVGITIANGVYSANEKTDMLTLGCCIVFGPIFILLKLIINVVMRILSILLFIGQFIARLCFE